MKKTNQAPTKNRRGAKKQRKQKAPARSVANRDTPIVFCYTSEQIDKIRSGRGEELACWETSPGEEQYLCRASDRSGYVIAVERSEIRHHGEWKGAEIGARRGIIEPAPVSSVRRVCFELPVTRAQAVKWLADNFIEHVIPPEFHPDFNRGAKRNQPINWRKLLCLLAGLDEREASDAEISSALKMEP